MSEMREIPSEEEVTAGRDEVVLLRYDRKWPDYVVEWSRRRHVGESTFPLTSGVIVSRGTEPDWNKMREEALQAAGGASMPAESTAPVPDKTDSGQAGSFFSRLLRRSGKES